MLGLLLWTWLGGGGAGAGNAASAAARYRFYVPQYAAPAPVKLGLGGGQPLQARALGGSWLYDWSSQPTGDEFTEAVPMLWGAASVGLPLGGNSRWLLGFNEPDRPEQANLTPERAAVLWRQVEERYPDRQLVSPAPSDRDIWWLARMRAAYTELYGRDPRFDALACHCYRQTAAECIMLVRQFVTWAHEWGVTGGVWVTEFAFIPAWTPAGTTAEREARQFVAYLDAEPWVTRYAPFIGWLEPGVWYWPDCNPAANPSLFRGERSLELTTAGRWYQEQP